jgi:molybdenum cofactor cytidylyltransferase
MMITQIILAAGLSSRMGTLKPLLEFQGRPLLRVVLDECRRSRVDTVIVVLGHERQRILDALDFTGVQVVTNPEYRLGQTTSVQAALRALQPATRAFLNLPVDHPFVTASDIDTLVDSFRTEASSCAILVPTYHGREGRPILFGDAFREEILRLKPEEPVQSVVQRFRDRVRYVPIQNPYTMQDMDTPDDYRECLSIYQQGRRGEEQLN